MALLSSTVAKTVLFALVIFSAACSGNSSKYKAMIKEMEESLENSNQIINSSTERRIKQLAENATDSFTKDKAAYWYTKATKAALASKLIFNYIEDIKKNANKVPSDSIQSHLYKYKSDILNIESSISADFSTQFNFIKDLNFSSQAYLTSTQNKIKIIENNIITYCSLKSEIIGDVFFEYYSILANQNSTTFTPGQTLEISAGVGSYSRAAQPKILIDGKSVELEENSFAKTRIKVPDKPGDYKVPVTISYFDQAEGEEKRKVITIDYKVIKPCNQQ